MSEATRSIGCPTQCVPSKVMAFYSSKTSLHTSDNLHSNPPFSHAIPTSSTVSLHILSSL